MKDGVLMSIQFNPGTYYGLGCASQPKPAVQFGKKPSPEDQFVFSEVPPEQAADFLNRLKLMDNAAVQTKKTDWGNQELTIPADIVYRLGDLFNQAVNAKGLANHLEQPA